MRQRALEVGQRANVGIGAGQRLLAKILRQDVAADVEVVGLRIIAVGVDHEMAAERDIERAVDRALVGGAAILGDGIDACSALRQAARNPRVDHIDDASDSGRAEQ